MDLTLIFSLHFGDEHLNAHVSYNCYHSIPTPKVFSRSGLRSNSNLNSRQPQFSVRDQPSSMLNARNRAPSRKQISSLKSCPESAVLCFDELPWRHIPSCGGRSRAVHPFPRHLFCSQPLQPDPAPATLLWPGDEESNPDG
mmetsp:Transcript_9494/g.27265  ORF Transcript_9494/g.27265 Transcript_9494/m.27265 type:complete len:141 (+) Transcript_9494:204-626(+)